MYLSFLRALMISSHLMTLGNALRDSFEPMMQAGLLTGENFILYRTGYILVTLWKDVCSAITVT